MAKDGSGLAAPDWKARRPPVNTGASFGVSPQAASERVLGIQRKLHKWDTTTGMPVESRMRGNSHVRFGGRRRADHRARARHRRLAADPTTKSTKSLARRASATSTAQRNVTVTRTGR